MRRSLKKMVSLILTVAMVLSFTGTVTWAGPEEYPDGLDTIAGSEGVSEDEYSEEFQEEESYGGGEIAGTDGISEDDSEDDEEDETGSGAEQEGLYEDEDEDSAAGRTEVSVLENTETAGEEENSTDGEEEIEFDSEEAMEAAAGTAAGEDVVEEPDEESETVTEEPAAALPSVPYMAWDDGEKKLVEMTGDDACTSYFQVDSSNYAELDAMAEVCIGSGAYAPGDPEGQPSGAFTWVVIDGEVTFTKRIEVLGTANIILKDGAKLTAGKGIEVDDGNTLNIYAQSEGDGKGELYASAYNAGCDGAAGIGGNHSKSGAIIINGGKITAIASCYYSAGIGGGKGSDGGTTTINGGHVTATGYDGAAGIGGGTLGAGSGGIVTINGGVVVAKSNGDDGDNYGVGIGGGGGNGGSGTLILGENVKLYEGSDNTGTVLATGPMDNVTSREQEMYAECVPPVAHDHSFTYSADGATITAECTAEGCGITEGLTLTISAPSGNLTYDGSEKPALLSTGYDPLAFPGSYSIVYETGGEPVDAPVNAGDYMASVTVGGATASVSYTIEKRPVKITADDQTREAGEADPELTVTISGAGDMACDFDEAIGGEFDNSSSYPWKIVTGSDNRIYAQSGNAGVASSSSTLSLTVTVAEGSTVSFDYKIMGEGSSSMYDYGRFLIDGAETFKYSTQLGDTWNQFSSELTEGEHTLTWTYSKDSSVNPTGDFFAIDNFVIVGVVGGGGLVEGETLSYTVSREEGDTAGSYPINVIPGENPNYEVTAVPGTLYVHEWSYQAEGATITAKCAAEGCNITEGLTMTISAPAGTLSADGTTAFPATLNDDYNTTAFPGEYAITYTRDGEPYEGVPTEAGEYVASVTVGGATASVRYSVHGHSFTYNADGATATASCGNEGCDITTGLTMTISAPAGNLIADGTTAFPATLNDDYNTTAFPGEYAITYTREGEPYDGVPTEAGHYEASVTVGDCVISVSYGIHELVPDGEGNHGYACDECGETFSEPCSFETAATENGNARLTCSLCGYSKVVELEDTCSETWDFNIDPAGSWIFVDADNDGKNWCWSGYGVSAMDYLGEGANTSGKGRNGGDFISSGSYSNRVGVLHPDNWAISPAVSTDRVLSARLSFYAQAQDANYPSEHFQAYAAHSADPVELVNHPISEEEVLVVTRATGAWIYYEYDIPAELLNGESLYLAIRHFNCSDMFAMNIDDVSYVAEVPPCEQHTLEHVEAAEATCTEAGHIAHYRCTNCGRTFSDDAAQQPVLPSETRPALGHDLSVTHNDDDTHTTTCSRCDYSVTEECTFVDDVCTGCGYAIPAAAPTVTQGPSDEVIDYGEGVDLSVTASVEEGHELSYQWYVTDDAQAEGTAIEGATESAYSVPADQTAGTYYYTCVVTATRTSNSETAFVTAAATVVINKVTPTVTENPTPADITYGGTLEDSTLTGGTASVDGSFAWADDTIAPAVSDSNSTGYTVIFTPDDTDNYNTVTINAVTLTVNPKTVTLDWTNISFIYDGESHIPAATATNLEAADAGKVAVTVDGAQTDANTSQVPSYTATATSLTGDSAANYALPDEAEHTFTIGRKEVMLNWTNTSFTYDGESHIPTATATNLVAADAGKVAVTVDGAQTDANTQQTPGYTATASGLTGERASNYVLPEDTEHSFTIGQKEAELSWTNTSFTYDGDSHVPTATVTNLIAADAGKVAVTVSGGQTDANTQQTPGYTATASGLTGERASNYVLPEDTEHSFTIGQKEAELSWTNTSFTYDGDSHVPTATVTNLAAADAGKVTVTVSGAQTDANTQQTPSYTATASGLTGERASNYKLPDNSTQSFTIGRSALTLSNITAGDITYGQTLSDSTVSGTAKGAKNEAVSGSWAFTDGTVKPAVSDSDNTEYGVTFTPEDTANYDAVTICTATLTVNPKVVALDWTNTSFTYDGESHVPVATATNLEADDAGKVAVTVSGEQTDANTQQTPGYTATVTGLTGDSAANYALPTADADKTTAFTISPKEAELSWTNTSFTYDGDSHIPTATATNLVAADAGKVAVTVDGAQTDANTEQTPSYTAAATSLSGERAGNYVLPEDAAKKEKGFTISPKAVTVTPDEKSASYGDEIAELTFTAVGLVGENDKDSLGVVLRTTATNLSPVGQYPITGEQQQNHNTNYDVTIDQTKQYTINEADAVITAASWSGDYDGLPHSISVSVTDSRGQETILDLIGRLFGIEPEQKSEADVYYSTVSAEDALTQKNTVNPAFTDAGPYTVYYAVEFGGNYKTADSVSGSQTVTITPKAVGLKWSGTSLTYNGKAQKPTATATGLVGGDKCAVTVSGAQKDAGTYTAKAAGLDNANYKLPAEKTQQFTIAKAAQKAPAAPVITDIAGTSLKVKAVFGQQYSIDGGKTWKAPGKGKDTVTFTGLKTGKRYTVVTRKAEKANYKPSPKSRGSKVKTLSGSMVLRSAFKVKDTSTKDKKTGKVKTQITVTYGKVPGATGYEVYVQYCDKGGFTTEPAVTVTNGYTTSVRIQKIKGKAIPAGETVKAYVVAKKGNEKLGTTPAAHIAVRSARYTDIKGMALKKTSVTLETGKTFTVKADLTLLDSSKKLLPKNHAPRLRFVSSDKSVATVDENGKVTAQAPGFCAIAVTAQNGITKKVIVRVK